MERRDTSVNDKIYSMLLPTPRQAMPLCVKAATLLAPVLPLLAKPSENGGLDAFFSALQAVDADAIDALFVKAVDISNLSCNNQPISSMINFDKHFATNRADVFQVCAWVLWESIKDFFPQLGDLASPMMNALDKGKAFSFPKNGE